MSNSELLAEEAIAFALEGADELERLGNREQSLVRAVPAIVADERQQEHIKLYEGEARRWFRLAKAVRQVADRTQLDELRAALEPFAAVATKLNPDLPDDTPITLILNDKMIYAYALSRFRQARKSLGGTNE